MTGFLHKLRDFLPAIFMLSLPDGVHAIVSLNQKGGSFRTGLANLFYGDKDSPLFRVSSPRKAKTVAHYIPRRESFCLSLFPTGSPCPGPRMTTSVIVMMPSVGYLAQSTCWEPRRP